MFIRYFDVHMLGISTLMYLMRYIREVLDPDDGPSVEANTIAMLQVMIRTRYGDSKFRKMGRKVDAVLDALYEVAKADDWSQTEYDRICELIDKTDNSAGNYGQFLMHAEFGYEAGVCTTPYDFIRSEFCQSMRTRPADATPENTENMTIDAFRRATYGKVYIPKQTGEIKASGNARSIRDARHGENQCVICQKQAELTCGQCMERHYCSNSCAFADWAGGHATFCGLYR
jgi:hypothetical protein